MRRSLAVLLALALPASSSAAGLEMIGLAQSAPVAETAVVRPVLGGAAALAGVPALSPAAATALVFAPPLAGAPALTGVAAPAAAPAAAVPAVIAMAAVGKDKPDARAEPAGFSVRLAGFFDGARKFSSDYFRRESRAAAVNAAAYLLTARDAHALPSLSRQRTAAAITALRRFRLDLGRATAEPGFSTRLSAQDGDGARRVDRLASHVRGIEKNQLAADGELEEPDSRESHVLGLIVRGRRDIEELLNDRARSADALRALLATNPHAFLMAKRFLRALTAPMSLVLAPAFFMAGMTMWPAIAAALWVVNEPFAVLRHKFGRDRFDERARARARAFLAGGGKGWIYDAKTYALQGGLVDALLRHGKSPEGILYPLWNNDFHGSRGLFGRLAMKQRLAASPAGLAVQNLEDDRDRWMSVDRLLRRGEDGEPELILIARSSSARPRFPKPAVEEDREPSWAPGLQPVPDPIPAAPRRR